MPQPKKPVEKTCLSGFMLMKRHRKLLIEKRTRDTNVKELTRARDGAREKTLISGKSDDRAQRALGIAESGLIAINRKMQTIEKELGYPQV